MNILNIASTLPSPCNPSENDIILVSASKHQLYFKDQCHFFVKIIPDSCYFLSKVSRRWACYYSMKRMKWYTWLNQDIQIISVPMFKNFSWARAITNYFGYLNHRSTWVKIIKDHDINVIHAHNVHIDGYIAMRLSKDLGIPYIVTSRAIHLYADNLQVNRIINLASAVISINHAHKRLVDKIRVDNSFLMPHGIDEESYIDHYNRMSPEENKVIRIVSLCRLISLKNLDKVIKALSRLDSGFVFDIYGDGPELLSLKNLSEQLFKDDRVRFMGWASSAEVPRIFSEYDIFIMPSYPETFGRVYFEAMAAGLPVIASKYSGISEYIENGKTGVLVDQNNIEEIVQALKSVMFNKSYRESLSKEAMSFVKQFAWQNIVGKLHSVYLDVSLSV